MSISHCLNKFTAPAGEGRARSSTISYVGARVSVQRKHHVHVEQPLMCHSRDRMKAQSTPCLPKHRKISSSSEQHQKLRRTKNVSKSPTVQSSSKIINTSESSTNATPGPHNFNNISSRQPSAKNMTSSHSVTQNLGDMVKKCTAAAATSDISKKPKSCSGSQSPRHLSSTATSATGHAGVNETTYDHSIPEPPVKPL